MRRYFKIVIPTVLALGAMITLSALGGFNPERPGDNELSPDRSSYNTGPTGTRALYLFLEESGYRVKRWRKRFTDLGTESERAVMIVIDPAGGGRKLTDTRLDYARIEDSVATAEWVGRGGHLLFISRQTSPVLPLDFSGEAIDIQPPGGAPLPASLPAEIVDPQSDRLLGQPTAITRGLERLAFSKLAARVSTSSAIALPAKESSGDEKNDDAVTVAALYAPVFHLADTSGAVLADFAFGQGRVVVLTDPFIVSNDGISRGANLELVSNLLRDLTGDTKDDQKRPVWFDEFHHGFGVEGPGSAPGGSLGALIGYFRGTSIPWIGLQLLALTACLFWSLGRRFARPIPLRPPDRHSPLEFVGSMARLQQSAEARDLAIENIYPRFRREVCQQLKLPARSSKETILAALHRRYPAQLATEIGAIIVEGEQAIHKLTGNLNTLSDQELMALIVRLRTAQNDL